MGLNYIIQGIMDNKQNVHIKPEIKILDSKVILDGFQIILDEFSKVFTKIKTEDETARNNLDILRRQNHDALEAAAKDAEEKRKKAINTASREKERDEIAIDSAISSINNIRQGRIEERKAESDCQKRAIESEIDRIEKAEAVLASFFRCDNNYDKSPIRYDDFTKKFPHEYREYGISPRGENPYFWYKKHQFVYGKTEVSFMLEAKERLGAMDDKSDLFIVGKIISEISAANGFHSFKMRKQREIHIQNALYAFVQLEALLYRLTYSKAERLEEIDKKTEADIERINDEANCSIDKEEKRRPEIAPKYQKAVDEIISTFDSENNAIKARRDMVAQKHMQNLKAIENKTEDMRNEASIRLTESLTSYFDNCLNGITVGIDSEPISIRAFMQLSSRFDSWNTSVPFSTPDSYCTFLCVGKIRLEYKDMPNLNLQQHLLKTTREFLVSYFSDISGPLFDLDENGITIPYVIDFTFFRGLCFDYPSEQYDSAKKACQSLMFHMLTDTQAASIYYTMIDSKLPDGFFSVFNSFRGTDARSVAILNNNKIFNIDIDIEAIMRKHKEALKNTSAGFEYHNIIECNRLTRARKRPINVIYITDISNISLLKNAYEDIRQVVSGVKIGYSCVFMRPTEATDDAFNLDQLGFKGEVLECTSGYKFSLKNSNYTIEMSPLPTTDDMVSAGKAVSECFKNATFEAVDFLDVSDTISKINNAYDGISIDNCMFDENSTSISYELNDNYINGLILGDPRQGKTRVMHAIIAGIMSKYSPEAVRINILDYKESALCAGVYSRMRLPHIGVISSVTNRVFGLNFLKYINDEIKRRSVSFDYIQEYSNNSTYVDKYSDYMRYRDEQIQHGIDLPSYPREVVIIDEIQELINEDDDITKECVDIIAKILRVGSAFGIHLIISTQWSNNIENRIDIDLLNNGFQSKILFHSNNGYGNLAIGTGAMSAVSERGQALYCLGKIEKVVSVALVEGKSETRFLKEIESTYRLDNIECNTKLVRSQINDGVSSEFVRFYSGDTVDFSQMPVIIGESLEFNKSFSLKPNQTNTYEFLMISHEQTTKTSVAATIVLCLLAKLLKSTENKQSKIIFLDYANNCEIIFDTIYSELLRQECNILSYYDSFGTARGIDATNQAVRQDKSVYLFINDIGSSINTPDNRQLEELFDNNDNVSFFLFGNSAKHFSKFETLTDNNIHNFVRAIYSGDDDDYAYTIGKSSGTSSKHGKVILCRGNDFFNHEILPFDYSTNTEWIKEFIKKLCS